MLAVTPPAAVCRCDGAARERLLQIFELPPDRRAALWRTAYAPANPSIYRGWSPWTTEAPVDIYDVGPDIVRGAAEAAGDPLLEPTPLPAPADLPGWREAAAGHYRALERVGTALMRSLARWLGLDETFFDASFTGGISTLRFMRYRRPPADGRGAAPPGRGEHVDSGFVTLLAQHGVGGLQAKTRDGDWLDVPAFDGALVVNFGALLERWTASRVRATPHRVVSARPIRHSLPFFFEPRVDAVIEPLPGAGARFEPFSYGDHLWEAMSAFPNFAGIGHLRPPRGTR